MKIEYAQKIINHYYDQLISQTKKELESLQQSQDAALDQINQSRKQSLALLKEKSSKQIKAIQNLLISVGAQVNESFTNKILDMVHRSCLLELTDFLGRLLPDSDREELFSRVKILLKRTIQRNSFDHKVLSELGLEAVAGVDANIIKKYLLREIDMMESVISSLSQTPLGISGYMSGWGARQGVGHLLPSPIPLTEGGRAALCFNILLCLSDEDGFWASEIDLQIFIEIFYTNDDEYSSIIEEYEVSEEVSEGENYEKRIIEEDETSIIISEELSEDNNSIKGEVSMSKFDYLKSVILDNISQKINTVINSMLNKKVIKQTPVVSEIIDIILEHQTLSLVFSYPEEDTATISLVMTALKGRFKKIEAIWKRRDDLIEKIKAVEAKEQDLIKAAIDKLYEQAELVVEDDERNEHSVISSGKSDEETFEEAIEEVLEHSPLTKEEISSIIAAFEANLAEINQEIIVDLREIAISAEIKPNKEDALGAVEYSSEDDEGTEEGGFSDEGSDVGNATQELYDRAYIGNPHAEKEVEEENLKADFIDFSEEFEEEDLKADDPVVDEEEGAGFYIGIAGLTLFLVQSDIWANYQH